MSMICRVSSKIRNRRGTSPLRNNHKVHVRHASRGRSVLAISIPCCEILACIVAREISDDERFLTFGKHLIRVVLQEILRTKNNYVNSAMSCQQVDAHREESIGFPPMPLTSRS